MGTVVFQLHPCKKSMMRYTNHRFYAMLTARFCGVITTLLCALLLQSRQSQPNALEEESPAAAPSVRLATASFRGTDAASWLPCISPLPRRLPTSPKCPLLHLQEPHHLRVCAPLLAQYPHATSLHKIPTDSLRRLRASWFVFNK